MSSIKERELKAVDFFCSGGGMTAGFTEAGIKVIGGIDYDAECEETYTKNNPGSKFIKSNIKELSFQELEKQLDLTIDDDDLIFIGCSPCQYWSNIKTIKDKSEESKNLLGDFQKFVQHFRPAYIVIENVPGILNRIEESPLKAFLAFLDTEKYSYSYDVINASHYGVPQTRRRFLLIASRLHEKIALPLGDKTSTVMTVRDAIGDTTIFKPIENGHQDKTDFLHSASGLSDRNKQRLEMTPIDGGTRAAWKDTDLQIPAYVGKDNLFQDTYGRLFWDKPAPTITTKFLSITNGRFAHPEQNRGLSLREGATLQTFSSSYKFYPKSMASKARIIGNAVPPKLSKKIAESILSLTI